MNARRMLKLAPAIAPAMVLACITLPVRAEDRSEHEIAERTSLAKANKAAKGTTLDAYITGRLITAYGLSEHLREYDIGVDVKESIVTLGGEVESQVLRDLAVEIARGLEEVKEVRSELKIEPGAARKAVGDKDRFAHRFGDASITARVKTRLLWSSSTSGIDIDVETQHQVVTLSGSVASPAEAALAEQITANTAGVARVVNRLRIDKLQARQGNT